MIVRDVTLMKGGSSALPPELRSFLLSRQPASLLVKGYPGCGKTIFSLQCVSEFRDTFSGYYLSTRVDARSLYEQFPWIKEHAPSIHVIDATRSIVPRKFDLAYTLEYASVPDFLKGFYAVVKETIGNRRPIIVVDSIEALTAMTKVEVEELCSTLIDFSKELDAKLILVTETHGVSIADYIVDGVVKLEKSFINGRLLRQMIIEKLRGIKISNPIYYFTLEHGRFQYFEKFPFHDWRKVFQEPHTPTPDGEGTDFYKVGRFSSGSSALDKIFGGFKRGSLVLFEVDAKISPETVLMVTSVTPENFLAQRRGVLMIPPESLHPEYIVGLYMSFVGKELVSKYFREVRFANAMCAKDNVLTLKEQSPEGVSREITRVIDEFLKRCENKTFLMYVSIDALESMYGGKGAMRILSEIAAKVQMEKSLCIALKFVNGEGHSEYRKIADTVLRIFSMNGVLFLYGVKPATPLFNVNIDLSLKHPRLVFTPIT